MIAAIIVVLSISIMIYLVVDNYFVNKTFLKYINVELEYFRSILIKYDDDIELIDSFIEVMRDELINHSESSRMNYIRMDYLFSVLDNGFSEIENLDAFNRYLNSPNPIHSESYDIVIFMMIKEFEDFKKDQNKS